MDKKASVILEELQKNKYDALFQDLYQEPDCGEEQSRRYQKAVKEFIDLFGDRPIQIYSAPGRSEVGGNHTDHQYGKVLAASVNIDTIAVVAPSGDNMVTIKSEGYSRISVDLGNLEENEKEYGTSTALIRGVAAGLKKRGFAIGGFVGYATSQVLSGSGLSSSAAYEILIGNILSGMFNEQKADSILLAQIGQEAENIYFGKPSGLMDQMACSVGGLIHIDFEDPAAPIVTKVDVDFGRFGQSLCIIDTKGSHADLTGDYAEIPADMKKVAEYFGKEVLRQVNEDDFYSELTLIRKFAGDRAVLRAIHYFDENRRVDQQKAALTDQDYPAFKQLIRESGNSSYRYLQNVYSNHKPEDQSLAVALVMTKKLLGKDCACRVHGGGFAGTIQVFVPHEQVSGYKESIEKLFGKGSCYVLQIRKVGGVRVL